MSCESPELAVPPLQADKPRGREGRPPEGPSPEGRVAGSMARETRPTTGLGMTLERRLVLYFLSLGPNPGLT